MREMKNSNVEWIGEIPLHWTVAKLKYKCSIKSGEIVSKEEYSDNGEFNVIGANGLIGKLDRFNNEKKVVTTGRVGTIGTVHKIEKAWITDNALILDMKDDVDYEYLYWVLPNFDYQFLTAGTAMPLITATKLYEQNVPCPPRDEKIKIAKYLDSKCGQIDSIISKQEAIIECLKEYKQSVITEAVTRGIDRSCSMKDSGYKWIGDIPSHWKMAYAKQLFSQRKNRAFEGDEQLTASQKYGIISQTDFMEIEGRQVMQVIKGEEILKHVEKGDFVISMRSFQGGLEYSEISGKISSAYVMLIPNHDLVYDRYYKWLFKCNRYITALQGTSNLIRDGQALRYSNFIQVYLPVLPINEQKEIADYLDGVCPKIDYEISKREELLEKIKEYKNSLVYEVVTGKKEV